MEKSNEILALQDFSLKMAMANALVRKTFKAEYDLNIGPYLRALRNREEESQCGYSTATIRAVADVDQTDLNEKESKFVKLLFLAAGYDLISAQNAV